MTADTSTSDSETIARSAHLEQDEAIRQDNRRKAQQQREPASVIGQASLSATDHQRATDLADKQAGPATGEAQGALGEAERQQGVSKAQGQEAEKAAKREDSVQRTQAVVSPFTKATVHRQIGVVLQLNHLLFASVEMQISQLSGSTRSCSRTM